jgi:transcriptional regulator with XRE-family HTH domain
MADALGYSAAYLSAVETGKKDVPESLVTQVADYFGLDDVKRQRLKQLAEESNKEYRINLRGLDDESRKLVANFARQFEGMSEKRKKEFKKLLEENDSDNDWP